MKKMKTLSLLLLVGFIFTACSEDDNGIGNPGPVLDFISYDLGEKSDSGVSGVATFNELQNGSVQLIIEVVGTSAGNMHPAHIHMNSAFEGGSIIVPLEDVDGATGLSITEFSSDVDGNSISFEDIEGLDAYINVHLSANALGTIVAQGDIGENDLTGKTKSYDLGEKDVAGISGTVLFQERVNGFALATISLDGTPADGTHPAHIHMNSALEGGGIIFTFNPVNGATGMSVTDTSESGQAGEEPLIYNDIVEIDAYVNVHLSASALGTIVAQGDIGENGLTGEEKSYDLDEKDAPGISGTVLFQERENGEALATISLVGTPDGGVHPAHIHSGNAAVGGPVILTFTSVDGTTGMSQSNVAELNDGTEFGYADVLEVDGYVNVHLSASQIQTIVAQGDIGANVE
jgi:hypothetical protein